MPEVMLGENGEEYVLDAFGPATRGRGLDTVYSGGPHASCTSASAPAAPEPTSSIPPTPPLAPYPNPVERVKQRDADCNKMVKEALDMSRTLSHCARKCDRAGEHVIALQYIRHIKKMGERCGQPFRGLHHDYQGQLSEHNAMDVYDGSGAPIAERSLKIAAELTQRKRMWDTDVFQRQLTWTDWFVNAMGRRPRW